MRKSRFAVLVALALGLVACFSGEPEFTEAERVGAEQREAMEGSDDGGETDGGGDAAAGATATFVAEDIEYTEAPDEVAAGVVEIELVNNGQADHNVVIENGDEVVAEASGGETASGTIELEPGEYEYHCSIPGHEATMNGTLTVTE